MKEKAHELDSNLFISYVETWISESQGFIIFRFRANFSGTTGKPEVRVVFDNDGKLAGFWLMPWKEQL